MATITGYDEQAFKQALAHRDEEIINQLVNKMKENNASFS